MNLKDNRKEIIQKILAEATSLNFEYEPSDIIRTLYEQESSQKNFRDRKLEEKESFFPNSYKYIKKVDNE